MAVMRLTMQVFDADESQRTDMCCDALSGGNPIAREGLNAILEYCPFVDPEYAEEPFMYFFLIDVLEVWDEDLAVLWRDVCKKHAGNMIAIIRSCQSSSVKEFEIRSRWLRKVIKEWSTGNHEVSFESIELELKIRSPRFNMEALPRM